MLIHRFLCAGCLPALVVGLGLTAPGGVRAQATPPGVHIQGAPAPGTRPTTTHITLDGPTYRGPAPVCYIDGERHDSIALGTLNPDDIERISALKDFNAYLLGRAEGQRGVIIIVTKAGQHKRAVRVFDRRLKRLSRQAANAATR